LLPFSYQNINLVHILENLMQSSPLCWWCSNGVKYGCHVSVSKFFNFF